MGPAACCLWPSLTPGVKARPEGKEGTSREPLQPLAEQLSQAGSGTFCSLCWISCSKAKAEAEAY